MERGNSLGAPADSGSVEVQPGVDIYYELHELCPVNQATADNGTSVVVCADGGLAGAKPSQPPVRMLFIMGFAASSSAWYPLLRQLKNVWGCPPSSGALEALLVDNRGIGFSSSPRDKRQYSTTRMAQDALAVMDHLGWDRAHVVGFSMGGMVSIKLASVAPERVLSLAVLSVSGGGSQVLPRSWKAIKYALKAVLCGRTPDGRVDSDLRFHFSKATLKRIVPHLGMSVKQVLRTEYLTQQTSRPQDAWAFRGQAHAVWNHSVTESDVRSVKSARFPVWFIHGRHDLVAAPILAEQLAARFSAPCVYVNGAHFIPRENAWELAQLLRLPVTLGLGQASPLGSGAAAPELQRPSSLPTSPSLDALALTLVAGAGVQPALGSAAATGGSSRPARAHSHSGMLHGGGESQEALQPLAGPDPAGPQAVEGLASKASPRRPSSAAHASTRGAVQLAVS